MFVRCMLHRSYTTWRNECKPKPAGKITWQLRGECLIVGQSYCFVAVTAGFSMSQTNCLTILLATSALAPLYFAPLLSCVVVQIVAKQKFGNYVTEREHSTWFKILNREYSQKNGREQLFERERHQEPVAGWHSCDLACASLEAADN